jgi:hypothetical protein
MTEAEDATIKQRGIQQHVGNADLIAPWKDLVRSERLARLSSRAVAYKRLQRVKRRQNVEDRNVRIYNIAKEISDHGWLAKSNSWIASRLVGDRERSVNTIRADVAAAKKFLMGSQKPNN